MLPTTASAPLLIIACGAIAREIEALKALNGWDHIKLQCLPAELHNRPEKIPALLRAAIEQYQPHYDHILVGYADCGTGGHIDRIIDEYGLERLPGAHCYAFFAGLDAFNELSAQEPGTLYLTDFLARHFERLMIRGLKIDQHPELEEMIFGNYRRLVYLAQTDDPKLLQLAQDAAERLNLSFEKVVTGYGVLAESLESVVTVLPATPASSVQ